MKFNFEIKECHKNDAGVFVQKYHYSPVFPRLTKHFLGIYVEEEMVGVLTLGWGTQPLGTIAKLFPQFSTKDYYEIGKMCLSDELPKNSESQMLKSVVSWIKINCPNVKLLYTLADGIMGKAGYVYQASNFYYGGEYWTDSFITNTGEKVHPRTMKTVLADNLKWLQDNDPNNEQLQEREKLFWPTVEYLDSIKWSRVKGKMFRYFYPLSKKSNKLLNDSPVWERKNYPKDTDLAWKIQTTEGYQLCDRPEFNFVNATMNSKNINQFISESNLMQHFE